MHDDLSQFCTCNSRRHVDSIPSRLLSLRLNALIHVNLIVMIVFVIGNTIFPVYLEFGEMIIWILRSDWSRAVYVC